MLHATTPALSILWIAYFLIWVDTSAASSPTSRNFPGHFLLGSLEPPARSSCREILTLPSHALMSENTSIAAYH